MDNYIVSGSRKLRRGFTTGLCAAVAAKAATILLLSGKSVDKVHFHTKNGVSFVLDVFTDVHVFNEYASCFTIKDAGDDPDVTSGIKIVATVSKTDRGIQIDGGKGVGRVTKSGLKIPVGQAAINPIPKNMIETEVILAAKTYKYTGGLKVIISVPNGEEIAKKTMNERLGIINGISILGTTGIVEPMSEKAIIDTIKTEIDMHISDGRRTLVVTPGNYGRDFAKDVLNININEAVKCSNFIGETLDYAAYSGVKEILLIGHAGKLIKLAGGIMNTHSNIADCRMEIIASHCAMAGASAENVIKIMDCITVDASLEIIKNMEIYQKVMDSLERRISFHIKQRTRGYMIVKYIIFTQEYGVLINSQA